MSRKDPSITAVAVAAGSVLTLGFALALSMSRRVAENALPSSPRPRTDEVLPAPTPRLGFRKTMWKPPRACSQARTGWEVRSCGRS